MFGEATAQGRCQTEQLRLKRTEHKSSAVAEMGDRLATIDMGRKVRAAVPFFLGGGAESPCNTMWPWPRPTSMASGTLIHPTVWPQYTNITDRTDNTEQTDNGPTG